MKKIVIGSLFFELTRKCNLKCMHCMRGEAQDVDLNKNVVDKFFYSDEYKINSISELCFSGGEPSLSYDSLMHMSKIIEKEKIKIYDLSLVLNGTNYDENFIKELVKICEFGRMKDFFTRALINIQFSNDQFHPQKNKEIIEKYRRSDVLVRIANEREKLTLILDVGNARANNIGNIPFNESRLTNPIHAQKMCFNRLYLHNIYINALGYVLPHGDGSYNIMDEYNLGNIKDKSLLKMIKIN